MTAVTGAVRVGGQLLEVSADLTLPAPAGRPRPLLGMSAPVNLWAERKAQVEATGGRLQARRLYSTGLTASLTQVKAAHAEGLLPVVSYKVGDWGDFLASRPQTGLRDLASRLDALGKPTALCIHHEPDLQSNPPSQGESGTADEFVTLNEIAADILAPLANVQYAIIGNGWWWSAEARGFDDAELDLWLPASIRDRAEVIAGDDYSPQGGEPSVVKTRRRAEWARRVGYTGSLGIGEFNGFKASDLVDVCNFVRDEPLFRGGWALVWNSTGGNYLPLADTGLLDDFQEILRTWPR